jgi:hypothetical protein
VVKGHQAVIGNDIPTKDGVIEFRFKGERCPGLIVKY